MMTQLQHDEGRPLTEDEIAEFRILLEKDRRATWVWSTIRVWGSWIASILIFFIAVKSYFSEIINYIAGK